MEFMSNNFMQGFELFSSQLMGNSTFKSGSSSPHEERKTHGEAIFPNTRPHNKPHELRNQNGLAIPKFLESKEFPYTNYDIKEATNEWHQSG